MHVETDVAYFEPSEPREVLKLRVPASVRRDLEQIARIWTALEESVGKGETVPLNSAAVRLLQVGIAGVWTEYGGKPETSKGEADLIARLVKAYKSASDDSKR